MATLFIRNKPDVVKDGRICKQRWDVIEVRPIERSVGGRLSGSNGREDPMNGPGNFIHLRIHIPSLSSHRKFKAHMEGPYEDFGITPTGVGEWNQDRLPDVRLPRRYYLDIDALPDWARLQLDSCGECTLTAHDASECIKKRSTNDVDLRLFRSIT